MANVNRLLDIDGICHLILSGIPATDSYKFNSQTLITVKLGANLTLHLQTCHF